MAADSLPDMQAVRAQVDLIDHQLLTLLLARQALVQDIGTYKHHIGAAIHQPDRANVVFSERRQWATELGLNPDFVEALWHVIHAESCRIQQQVFDELNGSTSP